MARATKISTADLFDPVEIDLWGNRYNLRETTRSMEEKLAAKEAELAELNLPRQKEAEEAAEAGEPGPGYDSVFAEKSLALSADMLDIMLDPIAEGEEKPTHAKALIMRKYKADEIGINHVNSLVQKLNQTLQEQRPT